MTALNRNQKAILERKIARWVWLEQRPVTISEIASQFSVKPHTASLLVHGIMHRVDGIRCTLDTTYGTNCAGHPGIVKFFSVQYLPDSYHPPTFTEN
ncbi:hypothetical protein FN906_11040 [Salmonella enterica subsp. enterica]|nr:hypothetical protein [Salmonella enterica subsp. enterica serovar Brazzaville]